MHGVIAAGHTKTAEAGAQMLRQGGNAVDAAVAAAFASFVAEPALVNIGGGGLANIYNPADNQAIVYDFFSTMPGLSTKEGNNNNSLDFRKISIDFGAAQQSFYIGQGSVAVPGVVAGLCKMIEELGKLSLAQVLTPTIQLARQGVALTDMQAYIVKLLEPILTDTPEIAAIYAPNGQIVSPGQTVHFKALADTLEQLGQQGASLFYTEQVGQKIITTQHLNGGLLTQTDLAAYTVLQNTPISIPYRDYTILLPPPSSGGGALIAFALNLLKTTSLQNLDPGSYHHLRILAEVMRITNIARSTWNESNVDDLLNDDNMHHHQQLLKQVLQAETAILEPKQAKGPNHTTHISVADVKGMVVSLTTSAGENAGFVVADTGVMLNNMLGEIDLHPNGFHQHLPGQRLTTMMSPVLVLQQGQPVLAIGSGGSNRLRTAILQVISNIIDFKMPLNRAVDASRIHFEDNELQLEGGTSPTVADSFTAAGYTVNLWPERNMFFGGTHSVAKEVTGWVAAGDSRRGGMSVIV